MLPGYAGMENLPRYGCLQAVPSSLQAQEAGVTLHYTYLLDNRGYIETLGHTNLPAWTCRSLRRRSTS